MCGYFGVLSLKPDLEKASEALKKLSHRGPDESSFYFDDKIYMGHNRLVVVDRENGKQPFVFEPYIMIYNGELYNTKQLRELLKARGHTFLGHSDTEVLIKMYAQYKEDCVHLLNGIYSFVIYNKFTGEVFACRDRAGVKPLFYYQKNNEFAFSSELKAFLHYYDIHKISLEGIRHVLALGPSRREGYGLYPDVYELKPGHYLKISNDGFSIKKYWDVVAKPFNSDFEIAVKKTRELLEDSVQGQLVSDVPLCLLLSDGLDSSAITALATKYKNDIETYSIDYKDNDKYFEKNDFTVSQDKDFIKLLVDRYEIKHHCEEISNDELFDELLPALKLKDYPGMVDIDSSLLWFGRQIKKNFTVGLSGECADEIFGGYPWYYRDTNSFGFPWLRNIKERVLLLNDSYKEKLKLENYVLANYNYTLNQTPLLGTENEQEKKHKQMFYLNIHWFMQTLLERKDRMTMGASFEVRVPFSDHRLIEYLYNVPWNFKFYGGVEKALLREAVKDVLPREILLRKKNPYPKTHNPKYLEKVTNALEKVLENKNSILYEIFDKNVIFELLTNENPSLKNPWFGQLMTRPQLIAYLYQFHNWFEIYGLDISG